MHKMKCIDDKLKCILNVVICKFCATKSTEFKSMNEVYIYIA